MTKQKSDRKPRTHLTDKDIREIKQYLANGASVTKLAAKYKITKQSVYNIKHGKTWTAVS